MRVSTTRWLRVPSLLWPAILLAATATGAQKESAGADVRVRWKGRVVALEKLPEAFESGRQAARAWAAWADAHEYGLDLDRTGTVLLVAPPQDSQNKARMVLVDRTLAFLDERLPAGSAGSAVAAAPPTPDRAPLDTLPPDEIPEDPPGDEPLFGDVEHPRSTPAETWAWGAGTRPLDAGTVTFFVLRGPEDYESLLNALVGVAPYLEEWSAAARKVNGFAVFEPLAGAMLLNAPGMEEWHPDAELVHRIATLLLARRFGQQPYWVTAGFSWVAELELRKGIYCFPYRDGFVGIGEHGGWGSYLSRRFADRSLGVSDFADFARVPYDDRGAGVAWGAVKFLLERRAERAPELLRAFYAAWDTGSRVEFGGGGWQRDTAWTLPAAEQGAILARVLGEGTLAELEEFLAGGAGAERLGPAKSERRL